MGIYPQIAGPAYQDKRESARPARHGVIVCHHAGKVIAAGSVGTRDAAIPLVWRDVYRYSVDTYDMFDSILIRSC